MPWRAVKEMTSEELQEELAKLQAFEPKEIPFEKTRSRKATTLPASRESTPRLSWKDKLLKKEGS